MKASAFLIGAALVASSFAAIAAGANPEATREQRMDAALQSYRAAHPTEGVGRFEKAENTVKRGAYRAGQAIKRGAHKAGAALKRTGEKIEDKLTPADKKE